MKDTHQKSQFVLSALSGSVFSGLTDGTTWNGFACPHFDFNVAKMILKKSEVNGYEWEYNAWQNVFTVWHVDDPVDWEPVRFESTEVTFQESTYRVYPIGAHFWTWLEISEEAE